MPPAYPAALYPFVITLTFAAALTLINLWLGARCSQVRVRDKVLVGDGGNSLLEARMRAHANFTEYTPFMLILMALIEYHGAARQGLFALGAIYVAGRLAHAIGMDRRTANMLRGGGALATWGVLLALAIWAFVILFTPVPAHAVVTPAL